MSGLYVLMSEMETTYLFELGKGVGGPMFGQGFLQVLDSQVIFAFLEMS